MRFAMFALAGVIDLLPYGTSVSRGGFLGFIGVILSICNRVETWLRRVSRNIPCLTGGFKFKYFLFSPLLGEMIQFDYIIFFRWVETTN